MEAQCTQPVKMDTGALTGDSKISCVLKTRLLSSEGTKGTPPTGFVCTGFHVPLGQSLVTSTGNSSPSPSE